MPSTNSLLNSSVRFLASKLSLAVLCCLSFHWSGNQSVWNLSIEVRLASSYVEELQLMRLYPFLSSKMMELNRGS